MTRGMRKWLVTLLRLIVCAAALAWVLHSLTFYDYVELPDGSRCRLVSTEPDRLTVQDSDGAQRVVDCASGDCEHDTSMRMQYGLRTTWRRADTGGLLICLAIFAPVTLIQSLRFQWMLRAQEIDVTFWESAKLCYAGNFLNFLAGLGTTGGDVFKMYYASLHTERKTEAVTTVVLDRVVGLFGMMLLVAVVIVVRQGDSKIAMLGYGVGAIVILSGLAGFVLFSRRLRALIRPHRWIDRLPFSGQLRRAESATRRLMDHKRLVVGAFLCTFALQAIAITSFVYAALALGMRSDGAAIWDYYAYLAGGMVVAAIPVSFQGLGTMEAFLKHALLNSHGALPAILCLAMTVRIIGLVWSLPGAIVMLTGSYRPRVPDEEIQIA